MLFLTQRTAKTIFSLRIVFAGRYLTCKQRSDNSLNSNCVGETSHCLTAFNVEFWQFCHSIFAVINDPSVVFCVVYCSTVFFYAADGIPKITFTSVLVFWFPLMFCFTDSYLKQKLIYQIYLWNGYRY